jgi:cell division protein FtsA
VQGRILVGVDVGTTKVCVLVAEFDRDGKLNILGVGVNSSRGLRRGVVVNIDETVSSIATALDRAERLSGQKITTACVGVAGSHIESLNSKGVVAISPSSRDIVQNDITRAIEAAQAISVPSSREIIHVIPRSYVVDGQEGVKNPIGMSGFRLEVETHIVTGSVTSLQNLIKCVQKARVEIEDLVLEPLASGEAVLAPAERELGVMLADIGGGTTDVAIFADGAIWQTVVLPIGGNLITSDIAYGLRLPFHVAEELKVTYGHCDHTAIPDDEMIELAPFLPGCNDVLPRRVLAEIIQARVEEIFDMFREQIKQSGCDGLLPSGLVLTGGSAELPGLMELATQYFDLPVRIGVPDGLYGLSESIARPAFATGVGLLLWGLRHTPLAEEERIPTGTDIYRRFVHWLQAFLP